MSLPKIIFVGGCVLSTTLSMLMGKEETLLPKQPLAASPYWAQVETGMGGAYRNGTLRMSYALGETQSLKTLGLRLALEHLIEVDANGHAFSDWRITGLRSSLVPADRAHLRWQPLAGPSILFERSKIGRALSEAGSPRWLIREVGDGDFEIRSLDGRGWRYEHGLLAKAEHPALGELHFTTQGGLLREIRIGNAPFDKTPILSVVYDKNARPVSLTLAGQEAQRFQWNAAGQLISWQRCDKSVVAFNYRDGLLSDVAEAGGAPQHFAWAENSGYGRGDSRWDVPVHLASDEHSDYIYSMSSKGFILSRRDRITRIMTTTIYNPRRRQLEQQVGNASIIVTFRRGPTSGNTGLESVVSGSGEILEEFSYDEKGQLIGMKRKGEPDRKLSYDESGRLMALDDLSTP